MSKTAIYLRQSLDRDMTKVSVEYQREQLRDLCAAKGWPDPVEYLDRNVSASKGNRPAYTALCEDIANGAVSRVAVWDMDRLHRQPRELEDFIDLADRHHVDLANVGGDVDLSTPSGRMFARVKGSVARYEIEQKSVRQKAANAKRAERGNPWNQRVFGYDGNEVVSAEADAIVEATRAVLNGATLYSIATQWNDADVRTPKGCQWTGTAVRQMLLRPRNAGLVVYGGEVLDGVEASWPAIVDRETFDALRAVLADPKRHTGRNPSRKHLLTGLALCGHCGRPMGTTARRLKSGGNRPVYACKRQGCMRLVRDLAKADAVVVDVVTERLSQPDAAQVLAPQTPDTAVLRAQIAALRADIGQTEVDYDEGLIDARRMNARLARIEEKLRPLQDKLIGANMHHDVTDLAGRADAAARFAALPLDRKRGVIDALVTVTLAPLGSTGSFDPASVVIDWK